MKARDMVGKKFGCLTVTGVAPNIINSLKMMHTQCDCGNLIVVAARDLRTFSIVRCDQCYLVPAKQRWLLSKSEKEEINRQSMLRKQQENEYKRKTRLLRIRQRFIEKMNRMKEEQK